ncbi:MAG: sensor histidine kinase [Nocardioides sp.]
MARLLAPVITRLMLLVLLLALIAIAGTVVATRAVSALTDDLQPAAAANKDVLQDLSDMQAAVRAYALGGQQGALDDYGQALARLPGHQQQVRQHAAGDAELDLLVARQDDTAEAWLTEYAEVRVQRPGGPGTFDRSLFRTGTERFETFRESHTQTMAAFDSRIREARDEAELRLRGTILAVALLTLIGAWGVIRARRRLDVDVAKPLKELETVVQKMSGHDRAATPAPVRGPREVRAVAEALNELAEAQSRARAVENRIQDELRTLDTARDDFVSNVSHELRTPLTTISGYLELVAEEFEDSLAPHHEKMLEATRRNVSRLRLLIDDLLTLSKAENRGTDLEQVDLGAVVRDVVTDVRMTGSRRGIRIETTMPPGELLVLGDRVMLHRAVLNIVGNAVKFSRDDGLVEVQVARKAAQLLLVVRDQGIGIPEDEIERLGTRFFRASNAVTNEIAGTGLGVRIVQTIIDKHAGDLVINSEERKGTTVTMRLFEQGGRQPAERRVEPEVAASAP